MKKQNKQNNIEQENKQKDIEEEVVEPITPLQIIFWGAAYVITLVGIALTYILATYYGVRFVLHFSYCLLLMILGIPYGEHCGGY